MVRPTPGILGWLGELFAGPRLRQLETALRSIAEERADAEKASTRREQELLARIDELEAAARTHEAALHASNRESIRAALTESDGVVAGLRRELDLHVRQRTKIDEAMARAEADRREIAEALSHAKNARDGAEKRAADAEKRAADAEKRAVDCEKRAADAEASLAVARTRHADAEARARSSTQTAQAVASARSAATGLERRIAELERVARDREALLASRDAQVDSLERRLVDALGASSEDALHRRLRSQEAAIEELQLALTGAPGQPDRSVPEPR